MLNQSKVKSIQGKEDTSHCIVWIWLALSSLFHRWMHLLCLLFYKERVAFENCEWRFLPFTFDQSHQFDLDQSYQSLSQGHTQIFLFGGQIQYGDPVRDEDINAPGNGLSKGPSLSWLTNFLQSTYSSLQCSTWLYIAVPGWTCLFPLLLKVATSMPYFQRRFSRSRTTSARNGL